MSWHNSEIGAMERSNRFPFQVQFVYYCNNWVLSLNAPHGVIPGHIEFSIRLNGSQDICTDRINSDKLNWRFPHILIKRPGDMMEVTERFARDTISFHYRAADIGKLEDMGMLPALHGWEFDFTAAIENLIRDFRHCLYRLYSPGGPERLDWICFQLLRELVFQAEKTRVSGGEESFVMKNISLWMQQHCCEDISVEDIARRHNMARATFYRTWQRHFDIAPLQYMLQARLELAARMLLDTTTPAVKIARDAGFCNVTEFYTKFKAQFGMTPAQYRKSQSGNTPAIMPG